MRLRPSRSTIPLLATVAVFALLYTTAAIHYGENFFSYQVAVNLLQDNSFLGLAAIGMTFVILSGGIDLSVGAMIGLTSILAAKLIGQVGLHPLVVLPIVLALGISFGAGMGALIRFFGLPPFLVTLAGMFLARGAAFVIDMQSANINHPLYTSLSDFSFDYFPVTAIVFLVALAIAVFVAHYTRFGRAVYAIGGAEQSAELMGLPVGKTKIGVYAVSGLCSSLAGIVYTIYMTKGDPTAGVMLELDAIAAVVIGGTLLTGGVGYMIGTLVGVLIYGTIQTVLSFEGTLSSWWTKIVIGILLLGFILLQRLLQSGVVGKK